MERLNEIAVISRATGFADAIGQVVRVLASELEENPTNVTPIARIFDKITTLTPEESEVKA